MAYEALTPARFKELKPQFAAVDDTVVQAYIDMAAVFVDESWPVSLFEQVWTAMTCHLMTLDGKGTDRESRSFASGFSKFQSIKSGNLTLSRYRKEAGEGTFFTDWLASTECGRYYGILLRLAKSGPRVAMGGVNPPTSGYAKDLVYGWPGVFLT